MRRDDPVPPGWERMRDPASGTHFYVNHELKVKSMVNPYTGGPTESQSHKIGQVSGAQTDSPTLPIPWQAYTSPCAAGKSYYTSPKTGESSWIFPGQVNPPSGQGAGVPQRMTSVMNTGGFAKRQGSPQLATEGVVNESSDRDIAAQNRWSQAFLADAVRQVNVLEPRIVTVATEGVEASFVDSNFPLHRGLSKSLDAKGRRSPSPEKIGSFTQADYRSVSNALHSAVSSEHPGLYSSMPSRARKLQQSISARAVSPSHRVGDGGGMRMIDRRQDARPWQTKNSSTKTASHLAHAAKYVSSPAVLDARGQRTSPSINSRTRFLNPESVDRLSRRYDTEGSTSTEFKAEAARRYKELYGSANHSHGSARIVPADHYDTGDLNESYTEELRRRADAVLPNRSYPSLRRNVGASTEYGTHRFTNDRYRPDVPLSRSLQLDYRSLANSQYDQRFESFTADSRRYGQSREAEVGRLALFSQRQQIGLMEQRGVLEALAQSYYLSHLQHEDLCSRFQVLSFTAFLSVLHVGENVTNLDMKVHLRAQTCLMQPRSTLLKMECTLQDLKMNNDHLLDQVRGCEWPSPSPAPAEALYSERPHALVTRVPLITIPLESTAMPSMRESANSLPSSVRLPLYSPRPAAFSSMRRSFDPSHPASRQVSNFSSTSFHVDVPLR